MKITHQMMNFVQRHLGTLNWFLVPFATGIYVGNNICSISFVRGQSMEPTLTHRSMVLVEHFNYRYRSLAPEINDIVIAYSPISFEREQICKRIAAVDGGFVNLEHIQQSGADTVTAIRQLSNTTYSHNGPHGVSQPQLHPSVAPNRSSIISIPRGHVFLLGDNRQVSRDSMHYGPVPVNLVFGRVVAVLWPLNEARWLVKWKDLIRTKHDDHHQRR
jgi:inner membrane protease subunit 1